MHYILESTFPCFSIFRTNPSEGDSHFHPLFCTICIGCFCYLSSFDNNCILIGHSKHCVQSRRTRGVLKIERYPLRLTLKACMGEASSYSWAPGFVIISDSALLQETCTNSVCLLFKRVRGCEFRHYFSHFFSDLYFIG